MSGACCVESTTVSIAVGLAVDVADRDLRLRVGAQPRQAPVARSSRLALDQAMRQVDRQRHELRRLVAGVAEHQALVARALLEVEALALVTPCAMSGDCLS